MNKELTRRVRLLEDMDAFIRDNIGDEEITTMWLIGGLPDGCDTTEVIEIAKDNDDFTYIVKCFARCVAVATDIGSMTLLDDENDN